MVKYCMRQLTQSAAPRAPVGEALQVGSRGLRAAVAVSGVLGGGGATGLRPAAPSRPSQCLRDAETRRERDHVLRW